MTKKDLNYGNVVENRSGRRFLFTIKENQAFIDLNHISNNSVCYNNYNDFNEDLTCKYVTRDEDIIKVYKDYTCSKVIWARKEELLTPEEKEWLAAFIKPFRDKVDTINLNGDYYDEERFISISLGNDDVSLPYLINLPFKFDCLELDKYYSLEDLGL